jgi:type IV pilus assembly protein PilY1
MLSEQTIVTSKTPVLLASSTIPEGSDCSPGGRGYLNMVDPYTGGAVSYVFLDINNDNVFDDKLPSEYLGSVDFGVGMPSSPVCVGNRCVVSGSQEARLGGGKFYVPPTKTVGKGSRISWREIVR